MQDMNHPPSTPIRLLIGATPAVQRGCFDL
jgi:hypothetical protein